MNTAHSESDSSEFLNATEQSTIRLFDLPLQNWNIASAVKRLRTVIGLGHKTSVAFLNAECINQSFSNQDYRRCLHDFDLLFADGVGMRWAAAMQGQRMQDNINGTDLFPLLLAALAEDKRSIWLLGGRSGIAEGVAEYVRREFPGVRIAGHHHGYLDGLDEQRVKNEINQCRPDALFVAMGAPNQELWIEKHKDSLATTLTLGVGGLFDFYSGEVSRAPDWMRRLSVEWVWRLIMQPREKARRYLLGNPLFLWRAWREARAVGHAGLKRVSKPSLRGRLRVALWRKTDALAAGLKRMIDVILCCAVIVLLAPLLILVAVLIRLESPGGVLFSQERVGKHGRRFNMFKFRSMYLDAEARRLMMDAENESGDGVIFKIKKDPRITRIGRVIRKCSIDELPQLWNVLKGDMSLVGPRPPLPSEVMQYSTEQLKRLQCRPGITCIWQVSGRSDIPFEQQVELDVQYIIEKSLWADIRILLLTIPAVLLARGAY